MASAAPTRVAVLLGALVSAFGTARAIAQTSSDLLATCAKPSDANVAREQVEACTKVIDSDANKGFALSRLYVYRATAHQANGEIDMARADFDYAILLERRSVVAYRARGRFFLEQKDYPRAIADFDSIGVLTARNSPDDLVLQCTARAIARVEFGAALSYCNRALTLRPGNPSALEARGLLYLKFGSFEEARADYLQALRLAPDSAEAHFGLGIAEARLGRSNEGEASLAKARQLNASIAERFDRYGILP